MKKREVIELESSERKEHILNCAYRLFLDNKIEPVSMGEIASMAGVGRATIFRYFHNKSELVIELCAREWNKVFDLLDEKRPIESIKEYPAIDRLSFTIDMYISLYFRNRDLILFNDNCNHYLNHEDVSEEQKELLRKVFARTDERFHLMYEKAKEDHTIRTDISEKDLIRVTFHSIMAICIHYAGGFVWRADADDDYRDDLYRVKTMIMDYVRGENG